MNGITSLNLPTLERRFQLTGTELGLIAASNDISAIIIVAFVSFFGDYSNKIRWLGYGAMVTGMYVLVRMFFSSFEKKFKLSESLIQSQLD